ncbi:MAG TPA: polyphosphate kinase 1, partial [Spirochaetales bacterium]|nr:polyphosphate kinase 1 [Spirochaetales bacterium]
YSYIATGNLNEKTAQTYVDIGLLTAHSGICHDVSSFFNVLTGLSTKKSFNHLVMAPFSLRSKIEELIEREIAKSSPEQPGLIIAKLNALNDYAIIQALYRASQHGVHIKLFVRGICQLIPGIPGLSETIEVRSLVGRFLEHSRIYYFRNGGTEDLYVSSADWMERNFDKRVELMLSIQSQQAKEKVKAILMLYFKDTKQARILGSDMEWHSISDTGNQFSVQEYFMHNAALQHVKNINKPLLIPRKKKHNPR